LVHSQQREEGSQARAGREEGNLEEEDEKLLLKSALSLVASVHIMLKVFAQATTSKREEKRRQNSFVIWNWLLRIPIIFCRKLHEKREGNFFPSPSPKNKQQASFS